MCVVCVCACACVCARVCVCACICASMCHHCDVIAKVVNTCTHLYTSVRTDFDALDLYHTFISGLYIYIYLWTSVVDSVPADAGGCEEHCAIGSLHHFSDGQNDSQCMPTSRLCLHALHILLPFTNVQLSSFPLALAAQLPTLALLGIALLQF